MSIIASNKDQKELFGASIMGYQFYTAKEKSYYDTSYPRTNGRSGVG